MPFEEGNSLGKGRPKGAENKEKKQLREFINNILEEDQAKFKEELSKLTGIYYINTILALMEYSVPKLARVENVGDKEQEIKIRVIRE